MNDKYQLFGLTESCTDEELEKAYKTRREIYAEDRFLEGEAGNLAAKKLTELDLAYKEIIAERRERTSSNQENTGAFAEVEQLIKEGKLHDAQQKLDDFNERNAEWHYLQAVVFYKKNWNNESKKQLEIAIEMDPTNAKYKNSYNKLEEKIKAESNKTFTSYTNGEPNYQYEEQPAQMGGDYCCQWCCEMAVCNAMLNCFCNGCG
ncbi:MAG: hypothetical protein IJY84_00570 [Clostridia bacterium]|nr:hypothetical protein [Clostridia bacterium]